MSNLSGILKLPVLILLILLFSCDNRDKPSTATSPEVEKLKVPEGFTAEHLYSPSRNNQGSWVAMTFDNKGRMITSDQYGSLYRLELPSRGDTTRVKAEKLKVGPADPADTTTRVTMGYAQGLLYAFNSLFVMVNNEREKEFERGSGLYRLQDTNNDDQYDKVTLLKTLSGRGEHGPHSLKLSPDGKSVFVIAGNFTNVPEMDAYRLPRVWQEDNIIPVIKDPRGHANDRQAPGGWIARVDPETNTWELFSAGFRNAYDLTFNEHGELFAYDSDMEWDFGMPWYRPTRICHVTSGSEFGWRTGNTVWPAVFPDNLPPVINIGQGSPTSLEHGMNSDFPGKYRRSLFAFDWSFGIIYAIDLIPQGSSYTANASAFVSGAPLPLTDGMFGPDGSLYFLTGGRKLDSDLYRVSANAPVSDDERSPAPSALTVEANLRREIETFHSGERKGALEFVWPHLKHNDRFIRYAARIAVEHQPFSQWKEKALNEKDPAIAIQVMIAFARHAGANDGAKAIESLLSIDFNSLAEEDKVNHLRALELVLARTGKPAGARRDRVIAYLAPHYPAETNLLNRSLSKVLLYLDEPSAIAATVAMLETAKDDKPEETVLSGEDMILRNPQYGLQIASTLSKIPPAQQSFYAVVLSQAKTGWTAELRERYFKWFRNAFSYKGGMSYVGFINKARQAALNNVPAERTQYYDELSGRALLTGSGNDLADAAPSPKGPGRNWTVEAAMAKIDSSFSELDFQNGKDMYAATRCISCHIMRGEGGNIGPDLTQLGTRFSVRNMVEHIILPGKEVSDQYAATVFTLKDGSVVFGRITNEDDNAYYISQNPFVPEAIREIGKKSVVDKKYSTVSVMMPGLINRLNEQEMKNLIAYLMAGGDKQSPIYTKSEK